MLFIIVRLAFWSMIFVISLILIRKSRIIHKCRVSIIAFAISVILTTISSLVPIENALITFSSLESAYNYNNVGKIKLVAEGDKTDFVVGTKSDTDVYTIVPKANGGWKIGMGLDTKEIVKTASDKITIYVYQYKNKNDYFVTVFDPKGDYLDITDNHNSEFKYLERYNSTLDKTFYTYYAYINEFDEQYALTVNGRLIKIQNN